MKQKSEQKHDFRVISEAGLSLSSTNGPLYTKISIRTSCDRSDHDPPTVPTNEKNGLNFSD